MEFGKRIKQMIMYLGMSQNEFGREIGVSGTVVSHWVNERNEPTVGKVIEMLNTFPAFSTNWLVRGLGPMLEADLKKEQNKDVYNDSMNERLKLVEEKVEQLLKERKNKKEN